MYVTVDLIKRYLLYKGYMVRHVMNITDVGHLTSDADEGEDKLERGAKREGKTVWEVAEFYTALFKDGLKALNILEPTVWAKATDHIEDQIRLIETLEQKGFTYQTDEAVYFDVSKFPDYTKLSRQPLEEKITAARQKIYADLQKRHPQDFALWFLRVGKFANHAMHWPSPWGEGFPGWHIECSAMSMKYLGETFDIHIGGIEHIAVHHANEIAQSQGATGKPFVKYWMHGEFLTVEGKKMAKSEGTFITLKDIKKRGLSPLAFRFLCLQAHYRSKLNFTWDALGGAEESVKRVENVFKSLLITSEQPVSRKNPEFEQALDDDFNAPRALSVFFETLSKIHEPNVDTNELYAILLDMDRVLGLGLNKLKPAQTIPVESIKIKNETQEALPDDLPKLIWEREQARAQKNWQRADEIRQELDNRGYSIDDTSGYKSIKRKP